MVPQHPTSHVQYEHVELMGFGVGHRRQQEKSDAHRRDRQKRKQQ
jgi:hypothetical protein